MDLIFKLSRLFGIPQDPIKVEVARKLKVNRKKEKAKKFEKAKEKAKSKKKENKNRKLVKIMKKGVCPGCASSEINYKFECGESIYACANCGLESHYDNAKYDIDYDDEI